MASNINAELVSANVLKYLSDNMSTEFVLGDPSKFDPNAEGRAAWVQVWLSSLDEVVGSEPTTYTGFLTGWACSRDQEKQYEHHRMAKLVQNVLDKASIALLDFANASAEVGRLTVRSIGIRDSGMVTPNYQKAVITIQFYIDQY